MIDKVNLIFHSKTSAPRHMISQLTCRNRVADPCGPGRCCTDRTAFCEGSYCCGSCLSCDTSPHEDVDHYSDPYSDADRTNDAGPPATTGCCYLGNCIYGPSASLLYLYLNRRTEAERPVEEVHAFHGLSFSVPLTNKTKLSTRTIIAEMSFVAHVVRFSVVSMGT